MNVFKKLQVCLYLLLFLVLKSQTVNLILDSVLINKPESMSSQNIPRKDIIQWNLTMLKKAEKENYGRGIVIIYTNLAIQYYNLGKPDISLSYLNKAKQMAEKINLDDKILSKLYQEYATVYYTMGLYDICLKYNSNAKYYAEKLKDTDYKHRYLNFIYRTRANTLATAKKDSALFYYRKAILIYETPPNYCDIAKYYIDENKHLDSAKIYLSKAELMYSKIKNVNRYNLAVLYYYKGLVNSKEKKYTEAISLFEKSRTYASNGKNRQFLLSLYNTLAENYRKIGNFEKEKEYLDEYKTFVDSYNNSFSQGVELTVKNIEEENKKDKKQLLIFISTVILLVVIIFGIYFYKNHRKKQRIIQEKDHIISQQKSESIQLEKKVTDKFDELYELATSRDPNFYNKFQNLNPAFIHKILAINPNLQNSELMLLAYIYLNFETKQIAELLFLSTKTIQNRKHNIRKKLNIPTADDMYIWLKTNIS